MTSVRAGPPGLPGPPGPPGNPLLPPGWLTNQASRIDHAAQAIDRHGQRIESLQLSFDELRTESHEGTAIAIALGSMHIPYNRDRAFGLRLGHYRSGDAVALAGAFRLPEKTRAVVDVGIAYGFDYSQTRINASLTWRW